MKKIPAYVAIDGQRFDIETKCVEYEQLPQAIESADKKLGIRSRDLRDGDFVQHESESVAEFKSTFIKLCRLYGVRETCVSAYEKNGNRILFRLLSDSIKPAHKKLYHMSYRLDCIDSQNREWRKPYYACQANR